MKQPIPLFALALFAVSATSQATTLTLTATADDDFEAYISTNDSVQGTMFINNTDLWFTPETGTVTLTPWVTHYLHVRARDVHRVIAGFIGTATLSDNLFFFDNGLQTISTNATDWKLSKTGFGTGYFTATELGSNGMRPWGTVSGVSSTAKWLWGPTISGEHYFSLRVTPVPEPASIALVAAGAFALIRRRRS